MYVSVLHACMRACVHYVYVSVLHASMRVCVCASVACVHVYVRVSIACMHAGVAGVFVRMCDEFVFTTVARACVQLKRPAQHIITRRSLSAVVRGRGLPTRGLTTSNPHRPLIYYHLCLSYTR